MSKNITKQHITDCFNTLSRKYPLDKITVNMIIEESGVRLVNCLCKNF